MQDPPSPPLPPLSTDGGGDALDPIVSRAVVVARLTSLMQGRAKVRAEALIFLAEIINQGGLRLSCDGHGPSVDHYSRSFGCPLAGVSPCFNQGLEGQQLAHLVKEGQGTVTYKVRHHHPHDRA